MVRRFETDGVNVDEILVAVIPMFAETAEVLTLGTNSFGTLLDKGTYLFDPFLYLLSKLPKPMEFISLFLKDIFYLTDYLGIHYFLINLHTDMIPRIIDDAAAPIASIL